jgi:hypothetical protein
VDRAVITVTADLKSLTFTHIDGDRTIDVQCLIRDYTNPPDAHPENANGSPYPGFYQPVPFPSGRWVVTEIWPNDEPYTAPFFIGTNAHQSVTCFDGSVVEDFGYGIHHSTSQTTWGCLMVPSETDLRWLVSCTRVGDVLVVEAKA